MQKYRTVIDKDRLAAGWGEWHWIIDTQTDEFLCLLPSYQVNAELDKLNKSYLHGSGHTDT